MEELLEQRRHAAVIDAAVGQLGPLVSFPVGVDDAVTSDAVQVALGAVKAQDEFHLVWHRVWGVRLRGEVIEVTGRLAGVLEGERAVLLWGHSPPVGFLVPVAAALRSLPAHLGPGPNESGPGGVDSDLVLVAETGDSGLRLEYNHYATADEYELRSWGRYARALDA
jgi:hypothetical protein